MCEVPHDGMIVRYRRIATILPRNAARRAVRPHVLGELTCGFTGGERGIATGANGIAHRKESIVHLPDAVAVAVTVRSDVRRSIVSRAAGARERQSSRLRRLHGTDARTGHYAPFEGVVGSVHP